MGGTTRETWAKRVERWVDSRLTAREYASEIGVNPRTLTYWKWRLKRECGSGSSTRSKVRRGSRGVDLAPSSPSHLSFVEITSSRSVSGSKRMELELAGGERVHLADEFDGSALSRLLDVLEGRR